MRGFFLLFSVTPHDECLLSLTCINSNYTNRSIRSSIFIFSTPDIFPQTVYIQPLHLSLAPPENQILINRRIFFRDYRSGDHETNTDWTEKKKTTTKKKKKKGYERNRTEKIMFGGGRGGHGGHHPRMGRFQMWPCDDEEVLFYLQSQEARLHALDEMRQRLHAQWNDDDEGERTGGQGSRSGMRSGARARASASVRGRGRGRGGTRSHGSGFHSGSSSRESSPPSPGPSVHEEEKEEDIHALEEILAAWDPSRQGNPVVGANCLMSLISMFPDRFQQELEERLGPDVKPDAAGAVYARASEYLARLRNGENRGTVPSPHGMGGMGWMPDMEGSGIGGGGGGRFPVGGRGMGGIPGIRLAGRPAYARGMGGMGGMRPPPQIGRAHV